MFTDDFMENGKEHIGPYDLQIGSQCVARDLVLVSNNIKEFERVPKLKYENWLES